jgi:hypothetical protein
MAATFAVIHERRLEVKVAYQRSSFRGRGEARRRAARYGGQPSPAFMNEGWLANRSSPLNAGERRLVDAARIELATSALRTQRSPS